MWNKYFSFPYNPKKKLNEARWEPDLMTVEQEYLACESG